MTDMTEFEKLEYERLSSEIIKDRELQFRLFWQSITVTAVIFSFCASIFQPDFWAKFPFIILSPHLILIPTATIILNRAKTANRKSGYIMAAYNKFAKQFNWERDLSMLRRIDKETGKSKPPHRAATIKNMLMAISSLEIICMLIFLIFLMLQPEHTRDNFWWSVAFLGVVYSIFYTHVLAIRIRAFFCTRYMESIQGYATNWIEILKLDDSAMKDIGYWDEKHWKEILDHELNHGILKFVWKILWSQHTNKNKIWEFKESILRPTLVALILWPAIGVGILFTDIEIPVRDNMRSTNQYMMTNAGSDTTDTTYQIMNEDIQKKPDVAGK